MSKELSQLVAELERDEVELVVRSKLERGEDPLQVLEECRRGMTAVGDGFQRGDCFLAELILSGEIFKSAVALLQPHMAKASPAQSLGRVTLATLKGDIHDLGKNLVAILLQAHGFEVQDLGVDVPPARVVDNIRETRPHFVGFSALITTAFHSMKETVEMLSEAGLRDRVRVMVGGGVTTPAVKDFVGADFQTTDAMDGVMYCVEAMRRR